MRPIWEGWMIKLDDVIKFRMILENIHTWAMRVFKPQIASYIGLWRLVHCQSGPNSGTALLTHRQEVIDRCQVVRPMVQAYLDHHSTIEIHGGKHPQVTPMLLGLLFHQMMVSERQEILQGVDLLIAERIQTLNVKETIHPTIQTSGQQNMSRRSSISTNHLSVAHGVDDDDPKDEDYVETQASSRAPDSDKDAGEETTYLGRRTRSNPQGLPRTPRAASPLSPTSVTGAVTPATEGSSAPAIADLPSGSQTTPRPFIQSSPSEGRRGIFDSSQNLPDPFSSPEREGAAPDHRRRSRSSNTRVTGDGISGSARRRTVVDLTKDSQES